MIEGGITWIATCVMLFVVAESAARLVCAIIDCRRSVRELAARDRQRGMS